MCFLVDVYAWTGILIRVFKRAYDDKDRELYCYGLIEAEINILSMSMFIAQQKSVGKIQTQEKLYSLQSLSLPQNHSKCSDKKQTKTLPAATSYINIH